MSCPAPDRILDYLARQLDARERDAIDTHVDGCSACRELLGELARTDPDELVTIAPVPEPDRIGRYKIEARLGEGGMGTVYAAYDPQLERRVAVKLVHPELAQRGGIERLLREGRALARLTHPNVVTVYDAGTDAEHVYIAMELVDGVTLAAWLRERPRTWRQITDKFAAAARGIAAAHHAGIVHRDVKPENVLLDRDGCPKVADFGLAGHSQELPPSPTDTIVDAIVDPTSRLTHPGAVLGTPMFMSPEQRRGEEVGAPTDQYSLCAALAHALGDRSIPRWLQRALDRGRAADPAQRFASIDALLAAIDPVRRARRTQRIAIAAVAAVAIAGASGYAVTRAPDEIAAACDAAGSDRTQLWTPGKRAVVETALRATGAAYAGETWTRVDAAIADYVSSLATAEAALCAHEPRGGTAHDAMDQGLRCLGERRDELAALVDRLSRVAPADVRFGVSLVHALSPVEDCANPITLAAEQAARATPAGAVTRANIVLASRAAREAHAAGHYREAADHAKRAVALARTFGGAILAKALLVLADNVSLVEGFPALEAAAREAATVAEAARADELRALAMANLMSAMAREPGHESEALAFAPLVEAAIERVGKRTALTPIVQQARGVAQLRLGRTEEAIHSFRDALATARAVLPHGDPRMPDYLYPVGVALGMLRRDEEALTFHVEAHRVAVDIWGPNHPSTARFAINLATKHAALGDCTTALDELAQARTVLTGVLPLDSPEHLQITQAMGACYYVQHDYDRALHEYTARQVALVAAGRARSAEMAGTWVDIGDIQLDRKDFTGAIASYRRSVSEYEALLGTTDARLGFPLARVGEAELAANHVDRAIDALDRAMTIYTAAKVPAIVTADVEFPLARALWSRNGKADRVRATKLAEAARDAWAAGGGAHTERKTAVETWLRAPP